MKVRMVAFLVVSVILLLTAGRFVASVGTPQVHSRLASHGRFTQGNHAVVGKRTIFPASGKRSSVRGKKHMLYTLTLLSASAPSYPDTMTFLNEADVVGFPSATVSGYPSPSAITVTASNTATPGSINVDVDWAALPAGTYDVRVVYDHPPSGGAAQYDGSVFYDGPCLTPGVTTRVTIFTYATGAPLHADWSFFHDMSYGPYSPGNALGWTATYVSEVVGTSITLDVTPSSGAVSGLYAAAFPSNADPTGHYYTGEFTICDASSSSSSDSSSSSSNSSSSSSLLSSSSSSRSPSSSSGSPSPSSSSSSSACPCIFSEDLEGYPLLVLYNCPAATLDVPFTVTTLAGPCNLNLTATGLPIGITASFSPNPIIVSGAGQVTVLLRLTSDGTTPPQTNQPFYVTVTDSCNGNYETQPVYLTVFTCNGNCSCVLSWSLIGNPQNDIFVPIGISPGDFATFDFVAQIYGTGCADSYQVYLDWLPLPHGLSYHVGDGFVAPPSSITVADLVKYEFKIVNDGTAATGNYSFTAIQYPPTPLLPTNCIGAFPGLILVVGPYSSSSSSSGSPSSSSSSSPISSSAQPSSSSCAIICTIDKQPWGFATYRKAPARWAC